MGQNVEARDKMRKTIHDQKERAKRERTKQIENTWDMARKNETKRHRPRPKKKEQVKSRVHGDKTKKSDETRKNGTKRERTRPTRKNETERELKGGTNIKRELHKSKKNMTQKGKSGTNEIKR